MEFANIVLREEEYSRLCNLSSENYESLARNNLLIQASCGHKFKKDRVEDLLKNKSALCPCCFMPIDHKLTAVVINEVSNDYFSSNASSSSSPSYPIGEIERLNYEIPTSRVALKSFRDEDIKEDDEEERTMVNNQGRVVLAEVDLKVDPVQHFTQYCREIGPKPIKTALSFLKHNKMYDVGSGNGAFARFVEQQGFGDVTCIDPNPAKFSLDGIVLKQPDYKYLADVPKIAENATLLLIAPEPGETKYDIEAIRAHDWNQIFIIYERRYCLGYEAGKWLEAVESGELDDNPNEYGVVYKYSKKVDLRSVNFDYQIIVLEKNYREDPIIENGQPEYHNISELLRLFSLIKA